MHMLIANPLLFTFDWWNVTCYFSCFLCRSAILLSCQSRKEYYHSLVEKTKEKNTDCKRKPAESMTLRKINWVILMKVNLLLNWKPKHEGEIFNLHVHVPGWKNSSGCDTKNSVSPKKLECPLENCWLGQNVPPKWNPRSDTGLIDIPVSKCIDHHFNLVWPR